MALVFHSLRQGGSFLKNSDFLAMLNEFLECQTQQGSKLNFITLIIKGDNPVEI